MSQVERYRCRRRANIQHGDHPLHLVMSGFVEQVADPKHSRSLAREVHCQPRRAAAKQAGYRIQFLATAAQIIPRHDEIGGAKSGAGRKQNAILTVPKPMRARRLRQSNRLYRRRPGSRRKCGGLHLSRLEQR